MNEIASECKKQKHHPEWSNVYNKTHIKWTTRNPEGLSHKDIAMARFCDEAGERLGELEAESKGDKIAKVRVEAEDCCMRAK